MYIAPCARPMISKAAKIYNPKFNRLLILNHPSRSKLQWLGKCRSIHVSTLSPFSKTQLTKIYLNALTVNCPLIYGFASLVEMWDAVEAIGMAQAATATGLSIPKLQVTLLLSN